MKIFKDRKAAGKLLAEKLREYKNSKDTLVLGIPRGGVVVAYEIAKELKLPLNVIITRKIGHPYQSELAVGAVAADGEVIGEFGGLEGIREILEQEVEEIKRREKLYRQGREPLKIAGKTVILVDDGIATGATILSAIKFLKRYKAKKIILAVPVASEDSVDKIILELGNSKDAIVLETPENFQAVGQFYQSFDPVEDWEVVQLLS